MKQYHSLAPGSQSREFKAHVFRKIDGQNTRFEYSKKRGWYKFGSRHQMVDEKHEQFGNAVRIFQAKYAEVLTKILRKEKIDKAVIFAEYWGPNSFCGMHKEGDPMDLCFFDISPFGGYMACGDFRKLFDDQVPTAEFLGIYNWTPGFVARVRAGEIVDGEGVVGKENIDTIPYMAKAKTATWLDRVKANYGDKAKEMSDE